ncbi:MAG: hypothetical protein ACOYM4_12520 [Nodosilinea sp.]|jgi:hypothetical protein
MMLRLLLLATVLTPLSLGEMAFSAVTQANYGSDTLDPVASCAPTQPEDEDEDEDEDEKPSRSTQYQFS